VHFNSHQKNTLCASWGLEYNVPTEKDELIAQVALVIVKLKVVHGPAALAFWQVCEKFIVILRQRVFLRDNLRLVPADFEDDVLGLLLEFQCLEHVHTFWVCGYTGRLGKHYIGSMGYQKRHVFVPSQFSVAIGIRESDGRRG
jgi:hypothetical protein